MPRRIQPSSLFLSLLLIGSATSASTGPLGTPYLVADVEPSEERLGIVDPIFGDAIVLHGSNPSQLTPWGEDLYFAAHDFERGVELWRSDGTAAGTRRVADVCPGECWGNPVILGVVGESLVFWADDGVHGREPWATDGTADGTRLLADLCPGACDGLDSFWPETLWLGPPSLAPGRLWRGELFFETRLGGGAGLWKTDGTPAGTVQVLEPCPGGACADDVVEMAEVGDSLLVSVKGDHPAPSALYRVAAGGNAAELVTSTCAGGPSQAPVRLTRLGSSVVFVSACLEAAPTSELGGVHLYATDGTAAGTELLLETTNGSSTWPRELTPVGDRVYFLRGSGLFDGSGRFLWRTDGTPAGTRRHGTGKLPSTMVALAPYRGELLMAGLLARDGGPEKAFTWTTADDVTTVRPLFESAGLPTPIGDHLFFNRVDEGHNYELWVADGTGEDVHRVADLRPGGVGSGPQELTPLGDRIFFSADDGSHGRELWALPYPGAGEEPPPSGPPEPPAGPWVTDPALTGFRVKARIHAGSTEITARHETECIPETVCLSGALPGRIELLVRVVGPKPNGRLWPTLVRFSTSELEVWIEQLSTGEIEYYLLEGATRGSSDLTGLFDREGFKP